MRAQQKTRPRGSTDDMSPTRLSASTGLHLTRSVYEHAWRMLYLAGHGDAQEHQHAYVPPCRFCACQNLEAQDPNRVRRAYTSLMLMPWNLWWAKSAMGQIGSVLDSREILIL